MNPTPTTEAHYLVSTTGMLHTQGCPKLTMHRSLVRHTTPEAAATIELRCKFCHPMPLGTFLAQGARLGAADRTARRDAELADRVAKAAAAEAERNAAFTPEADAAILAFFAADAAEAPEAGQLYHTMLALLPDGTGAGYVARHRHLTR